MEGDILIIDDEEEILRTLDRCLTLAGHEAHTCRDPLEALEKVRPPDLRLVATVGWRGLSA